MVAMPPVTTLSYLFLAKLHGPFWLDSMIAAPGRNVTVSAFASIFESMHVAPRKRLFEATSFCIMISVIVGLILPIFALFLDSFFISRQRVTSIRTPPQVFLILCLQAPGTLVHSAIAF